MLEGRREQPTGRRPQSVLYVAETVGEGFSQLWMASSVTPSR